MSIKIDAHQHFWDLSMFDFSWMDPAHMAAIRRNRLPGDLKPLIDEVGVNKTVFVQTQHNLEENRWVLGLIEEHDFIAGMVGWVDLRSEACEDQLAEFKDDSRFVGIRHVVQDEPDEDWMVHPDTLRGLKVLEKHGVPYDLLFFVQHLKHAETVARYVPDLPLVIDHLAKPKIKDGEVEGWLDDFKKAAACENVYCKLSGMITEADWANWQVDDLRVYVDHALALFGPERLMFGSDWPVCELAGSYSEVHDALEACIGELSGDEQAQIWSGTAKKFYNLEL